VLAQGAWPSKKNSYDVTSVGKSKPQTNVILTGDSYGHLRLYRYPCVKPGSCFQQFQGHSGSISNITFTYDDTYALSSGESDRCIFQWRLEREVIEIPPEFEYHATSDDETENNPTAERSLHEEASNIGDFAVDLLVEEMRASSNSDGLLGSNEPVKAWVGSCIAPTTLNLDENNISIPNDNLEIQWVYGYRSHDCRNNIKYTKQGNYST